jgi:hypothetical protein
MAAAHKFTTKGVKDATLLVAASGGGAPTEHDIYAIEKLDFEFKSDELEVWGDDTLLTTWVYGLKGTLKFETSYLDPDILTLVFGDAVDQTGSGGTQEDTIMIGTESVYNCSPSIFRFTMDAKDDSDVPHSSKVTFFKATPSGYPKFDGMDTKGRSKYAWVFALAPSDSDEEGDAINPKAMAKLVVGPTT